MAPNPIGAAHTSANLGGSLRILLVTRSYPAPGDLYQYPFVHRRVVAYIRAGQDVAVFRPTEQPELGSHQFEDVTCFSGDTRVLRDFVARWQPAVIAVHGFSEQMWEPLVGLGDAIPICAWLHGSEIPGFFRQKANCIADPAAKAAALQAVEARCAFWDSFLRRKPKRFKLVFVSNSAVDLARQDWGAALHPDDYAVIPNPIDTDLFVYRPKVTADRWRILMIRPFDSPTYGNDLAVSALLALAERSDFDRLRVTIVGDGPLFDETLHPLKHLDNVRIERRFLTQTEIAQRHRSHGIFLVPTRLDTQGVSRDEAMSSGLVPVTNRVSAIPEFVDDRSAALAPPEDAVGLADGVSAMLAEPSLFLRRSAAAAKRVRQQSGHEKIIPREVQFLSAAAQR
ncbi:MAG: glycosyltransferase family 4 protein [Pseudomonadota bacterium]|nr:glycosyltransferase family 4 protein [Pseudomonadota bacterium]